MMNVCVGASSAFERTTTGLCARRCPPVRLRGGVQLIIALGVTKALTDLVAGPLTARPPARPCSVTGSAVGLPVPFLLAWAPAWGWIVAANLCLGINQA